MNSYCFMCFTVPFDWLFEVLYPEHATWDTTHYCSACFLGRWLGHKKGIRPMKAARKRKCTSVKSVRKPTQAQAQ